MDEMEYLQPSFDPSNLTMPRLRNILMTHDIPYPASAKKQQLVEIFTQQLKPKARKLLAARDRVRRTSEGITNMPSTEPSETGDDDEDRISMPPPSAAATPRSRAPRRSARSSTEETIEERVPTASSKSTGRKSATKLARQSDTETETDAPKLPAQPRSRKSQGVTKVKQEVDEVQPVRPLLPESAFSDENPFQSGSSPLAGEPSRRKSSGTAGEKRKSTSTRRKTEERASLGTSSGRQADGVNVASSHTVEMPLSKIRKTKHTQAAELEPGEEFTPEEQSELAEQQAGTGKEDKALSRVKRPVKKSAVPRSAPWLVLLSLLVGFATWYRQEKIAIGYCGLGRSTDSQLSVQTPDWASFIQPSCEPCPQHAICYQGLETSCEQDFILVPHPFSFGGLVPIPPSCQPDGEKARKIKAVADRAIEMLRQRKAEAECGTATDSHGRKVTAEVPEPELKKEVGKNKRRGMSDAEFEELWKGAVGEIEGREEVVSSQDGRLLSSTSFARLPLGCALRRSARLTVARYRKSVSLVMALALALTYARSRIRRARADVARVPALVATTLDRLATQAALHARGDAAEPWISVGQLRDDILRDVFSDARRESMWARVRAIVERNANVRAAVREGRAGDVSRVWEWIGSVGFLDEGPTTTTTTTAAAVAAGHSRKSIGQGKRVSFGALEESSPSSSPPAGAGAGGGAVISDESTTKPMAEVRKWDEGRPVY